jgi:hypothetical protein
MQDAFTEQCWTNPGPAILDETWCWNANTFWLLLMIFQHHMAWLTPALAFYRQAGGFPFTATYSRSMDNGHAGCTLFHASSMDVQSVSIFHHQKYKHADIRHKCLFPGTLQRQNTEILKQIFPEKEYRGLSPNFHIHASVSDLYISTICLPILLEEICRPILGLYKSLTDTWMWKLGRRPRYSQKRNT